MGIQNILALSHHLNSADKTAATPAHQDAGCRKGGGALKAQARSRMMWGDGKWPFSSSGCWRAEKGAKAACSARSEWGHQNSEDRLQDTTKTLK